MDKNKNLVIALIITALVVIGIIYYSGSKNKPLTDGSNEASEQRQGNSSNFRGPTGDPYIKGPGSLPPISE